MAASRWPDDLAFLHARGSGSCPDFRPPEPRRSQYEGDQHGQAEDHVDDGEDPGLGPVKDQLMSPVAEEVARVSHLPRPRPQLLLPDRERTWNPGQGFADHDP